MTDPVPDISNKLAHWIGRVFHPAILCVPTLALILREEPLLEAVLWTVAIASIVTVPGLVAIALLKRRERYVYQRQNRAPVYLILWLCVGLCSVIVWLGNGPRVLLVCLVSLLLWLPVQMAINSYFTKISTHTAVAAGCATGLLLLGDLNTMTLQVMTLAIVLLVMWSRVVTRNHTKLQVVLGLVVGCGTVLLVFPLLLR